MTANRTRHLREEELEPETGHCPICGGSPTANALRLQADPGVWMARCTRCHGCSASRLPKADVLKRYYDGYYGESQGENVTFTQAARLAQHILDIGGARFGSGPLHILDFGGGDGAVSINMAESLIAQGLSGAVVTLVDVADTAAGPASASIQIQRADSLSSLAERSFDIVIASAVFEHIPEPAAPIRETLARLKPGGLFYARTPYHVPLAKFLSRFGRSFDMQYPHHIHDMGQAFWENVPRTLALDDSFQIVTSRPSIVSSTFSHAFARTLAAYALKSPWYVLGRSYRFVGGWEILIVRN